MELYDRSWLTEGKIGALARLPACALLRAATIVHIGAEIYILFKYALHKENAKKHIGDIYSILREMLKADFLVFRFGLVDDTYVYSGDGQRVKDLEAELAVYKVKAEEWQAQAAKHSKRIVELQQELGKPK